jgi:hypothetical protein
LGQTFIDRRGSRDRYHIPTTQFLNNPFANGKLGNPCTDGGNYARKFVAEDA